MVLSLRERRILSELSMDSRKKQADIAREMRISPQILKYHIDSLREKQAFKELVIVDPAKFGLITVRVFLSFTTFTQTTREIIIDTLLREETVIFIQRLRLGADLLIEYAVPNLSLFNKIHSAFLDKFSGFIKNKHIYPVLVRYEFERTYLHPSAKQSSAILSGDRDIVDVRPVDRQVISALIQDPSASLTRLSEMVSLDHRTISRAIQNCLSERIIRGFSIVPTYSVTQISSALLGVEFSYITPHDMKKFISFVSEIKEVVALVKVIGQQNVFIRIESLDEYTAVIERICAGWGITDYVVYGGGDILKSIHIPRIYVRPERE